MTNAKKLDLAMSAANEIRTCEAGAKRAQLIDLVDNLVGRWEIKNGLKPHMRWPANVRAAAKLAGR